MIFDFEGAYMSSLSLEYLKANACVEGSSIYVKMPIDADLPYDFKEYLKAVEYYLNADNKYGVAYR